METGLSGDAFAEFLVRVSAAEFPEPAGGGGAAVGTVESDEAIAESLLSGGKPHEGLCACVCAQCVYV